MNHLIFDTETTGFYNPKLSPTHQAQARVIQLAAIKLDSELNEVACINTLIKPQPHFVISEGAFSTHGISIEQCNREGREQKEVIAEFDELCRHTENIVCHNAAFDSKMMAVEYKCAGLSKHCYPAWFHDVHGFMVLDGSWKCTMEYMTNLCHLPLSRKGMFGQTYKWPKLIEALTFIGKPFVGREHDGLSDARACAEIYRYLIKQGIIKLPSQPIAEVKLA